VGHQHSNVQWRCVSGHDCRCRPDQSGLDYGYRLARDPYAISAADVIDALEGPVSITECSATDSHCDFESTCSVGNAWQRVNVAIRHALNEVTLIDLLRVNSPVPKFRFAGMAITVEEKN
jgi:DNA-binding IscR family transcriptional regulator